VTVTDPAQIPVGADLERLRTEAAGCRACDLWENATATVFGEGPRKARIMMVGEQPGDREDIEGHPFVGPAGRVLDQGLERAGIARDDVYLTNVVKHFRWRPRGKRRIHQRPNAEQIDACRPWLESELEAVRPQALCCLGAVAAQALLGRSFRVSRERGQLVQSELAPIVTATVHPSSILRTDDDARDAAMEAFVADLRFLAGAVEVEKTEPS
jgi:uracil-DNA glycosylase